MFVTRSLLLATAGHVDHGKSSFVKYLTGKNPDRLPQEQSRGMTLDLGFASTDGVSFIDCPGHDGFVKHLISGQSAVDGACLIVAATEGLKEQTLEHIRILNWLGLTQVMVVITKMDLINTPEEAQTYAKEIYEKARELISPEIQTEMLCLSRKEPSLFALNKIKRFFHPHKQPTNRFYNRFFIDRIFTIDGTGTIATGSFSEGHVEAGSKGVVWLANNKRPRPVTIKAIRQEHFSPKNWGTPGRVAFALDGISPEEAPRGSVLLFTDEMPELSRNLALDLQWALPMKHQFTATLQVGTLSLQAKLRLHPKGFWRAYLEMLAPIARGDRVVIRLPERVEGMGHTIAGGTVVDAYLPTRQLQSPPPVEFKSFIEWCRKHAGAENYTIEDWALRLGLATEELTPYTMLAPKKPARVKASIPQIQNEGLLQELNEKKWEGFAKEQDLNDAHTLVKLGFAFHIKENHFLHRDHYEALMLWLNEHFATNENLAIHDARLFFNIGRKHLVHLLEFCDRHKYTFRKGEARIKFKLPSYSRPSFVQPSGARGDGQQSGPLLS